MSLSPDHERSAPHGSPAGAAPRASPAGAAPRQPPGGARLLALLPALVATLILSAHFLRTGRPVLVAIGPAALGLLLLGRRWALRALQVLLFLAAGYWLTLLASLAAQRQEMGLGWGRLAGILVAVSLLTALAAWLLEGPTRLRERGRDVSTPGATSAPFGAFLLTAALLGAVQAWVPRPMLLPERFAEGAGWWAVLGLATWAGWLTERLGDPAAHPRWRARAWGLFSFVFFGQLALGLAGLERFLMSGVLHVPVPAVILGGPLFRGEGFFMITLFLVTLVVVGPAWCSWLCYIGAWDNALARTRKLARAPASRFLPWLRVATLAGTVAAALGLRAAGVPGPWAAALALLFGGAGVVVMVLGSRATGTLVHCTSYCPLGLVAALLGRLSPHRLRITSACTDCGACTRACRYDALSPADVGRRRPGLSCTLCGDCLPSCRHGALAHHFPGLSPAGSRALFLVLVVSLHAVTLGVARI